MSYETSDIELGPTWRRDLNKQNGRRSSTTSSSSSTAGSLPLPSSRGRALSASTTTTTNSNTNSSITSQPFPALARPLTRPNSVWERGLPRRSLDEDRYQRRSSMGQISPTESGRRFRHHVPSLIKPQQPLRNVVRPVNAKLDHHVSSTLDSLSSHGGQMGGFRSLGTIRQKKSTIHVEQVTDQNQNGDPMHHIPADEAAFCTNLCPDWQDYESELQRPLLTDEVRQWARQNPAEACRLRERAKMKRARGQLDHSDERVLAALETSNNNIS